VSADEQTAGTGSTAGEPRRHPNPATAESAFIRACRREPVPHTPVWFMRQAGRSLPEYHKVREGIAMLDSCMRPDLVTEITLQPVRRHKVDAAIYFSDIVVPLKAIGLDLDIKPGVGPVVAEPIRTRADLERLRALEPDDVSYVTEAIGMLTAELGATPLIGFAGAPFTLASYLVEGGPSRNHEHTKALMYGDPELWADLLDRLADITAAFLKVQIEAGASAVQLFDSWVGALAPDDYRRSVMPASAKVFDAVAGYGVPRRIAQGAPGQPRPGGALRADPGRADQGPRGAARRAERPRPHLQPRPRRAAQHRPRRAHPARRVRPHHDRDALTRVAQWTA
jgi:uroporphyrinogen decarboxylase